MAKEIYVGVNDKARKVKKAYVGIDGVAHKVLKVYVGDGNNKARLCWVSECQHPSLSNNLNYFWGDNCEYCTATAICPDCGYQETETDYYPEFRVYEEPTCTEDGKGDYHAYFSNELFEDNYSCPDWHTIEALGHDMGSWEITDDERYCLRHCLRNGCSVSEQKTHDIDYSLNPTIYYSDTSAEISWSIPLDTNYCELDGNYVEGMSGSVDTPGTHYIYIECECPNCGYMWSIKDTVYVNQAPVPSFWINDYGCVSGEVDYAENGEDTKVFMQVWWYDAIIGYFKSIGSSEIFYASDGTFNSSIDVSAYYGKPVGVRYQSTAEATLMRENGLNTGNEENSLYWI